MTGLDAPPAGAVGRAVRTAVRAHRGPLLVAVGLVLVLGAAGYVTPLLVREAVDAVLLGEGPRPVGWPAAGILAATVTAAVVIALIGRLTATVGERILHELRGRAVAGALGIAPAQVRGLSRADVVTRLTSDVDTLSVAARQALPTVVRAVVLLVAGLAALAVLHPLLAASVAVVVVAAVAWGVRVLRSAGSVYRRMQQAEADAATVLAETTEAGVVITESGAAPRWCERIDGAAGEVVEAELAAMRLRNRLFPVLELLEALGAAAVLGTGVLLVLAGEITIGTLSGAVLAVAAVFGPVAELLQWLDALLQARAALARVVALAERAPDVPEPTSPRALPQRGDLVAENLRFAYEQSDDGGDRDVLHDVDVVVRPGERVALVGPTGAGKSTLAHLVARSADPTHGRVSYGGVDLRDVPTAEVRRRVVIVSQDGYLPAGTLGDAVRWACPDASDAAVADALDAVGAGRWWRSLPAGLDTLLGPDGTTLSSGQLQLVALARVALVDPAVLVLDEATSRLDPHTERLVDDAVMRLSAGRALLVVAHRPETTARADRFVRLEDGRVVPGDSTESSHRGL